jgi:hypothetical protein
MVLLSTVWVEMIMLVGIGAANMLVSVWRVEVGATGGLGELTEGPGVVKTSLTTKLGSGNELLGTPSPLNVTMDCDDEAIIEG